jgi:hypothetical protein
MVGDGRREMTGTDGRLQGAPARAALMRRRHAPVVGAFRKA